MNLGKLVVEGGEIHVGDVDGSVTPGKSCSTQNTELAPDKFRSSLAAIFVLVGVCIMQRNPD